MDTPRRPDLPSTKTHGSTRAWGVAVAAALVACGGDPPRPSAASGPPAAAPSAAPAAAAPVDVWAALLKGGLAQTLRGEGGATLTVSAEDARALAGGQGVRLKWTLDGAPFTQPPSQIAADATSVRLLDASLEDADVHDALQAPSPWPRQDVTVAPMSRLDGLYAQVWRRGADVVVCYGEGPPPDAPPCEDVCFAEMCVSPQAGVVELSGTWAPNFGLFAAEGYGDFRERFTADGSPGRP